jgi:Fe-S cluster assembly protein SufD
VSAARGPTVLERIGSAQAEAEPRLGGGPLWAARRQAALQRLLARGLPTRRDENWKYLNLRSVEKRDFRPVAGAAPDLAAIEPQLVALPDACRIVLVDGRHAPWLSSPALPAGVVATPLHEALARSPESLAGRLAAPGDGADERFALLAEAFTGAGLVLELAAGAEVSTPLYIVHVSTGRTPGAAHSRVVIDARPRARAVVVEHFLSVGGAETLQNLQLQVDVADGAQLDHYRVQQLGTATAMVETLQVRVGAQARYEQHGFPLGAAIARTSLRLVLDGEGAEGIVNGLFLADGSRQVDLYTLIEHARAHTRSVEMFRGIAADTGHGAFNGRIIVQPGAQKSDSSQSSRNLILSPAAEIDARPQLEIHADDVKCSHGATIGSLDPNQLFYLLSRGLDRATAQGLLTFAFCEDVLRRVRLPALRRHLELAVVGRLPDRDIIREFV